MCIPRAKPVLRTNPIGKSSLAAIKIVGVDVTTQFFAFQAINSSSWVKDVVAAYC
jgi:hypothetical protein